MAALISRATGVDPYYVGKPNPLMMRSALNAIDAHSETTAMIGDRMDTDIVAGLEAGLETILVLTGVTTPRRRRALPVPPVADRRVGRRAGRRAGLTGRGNRVRAAVATALVCAAAVPAEALAQQPPALELDGPRVVATGVDFPLEGTGTPAGTRVVIEIALNGRWRALARARADASGRFDRRVKPSKIARALPPAGPLRQRRGPPHE